jgi:transposase
MANRRTQIMDVREIIHRLRVGNSRRQIARELNLNWRTVQKYATWAEQEQLLRGDLPPLETIQARFETAFPRSPAPQNQSSVTAYQDMVVQLRKEGVEIAALFQRLQERGYTGSYSSVYRFIRKLEPHLPDVTVRVEQKPGQEAQVDFGYGGRMLDPRTGQARKTWAFVMTLAWSRHQYVEFVFDQKVETWLRCHRNAFTYFGGVPMRVVIDNLKAAITQACWHDSQVQQAYRECAEHYGFLIAPCRPRTPQHKGKVEQGGVHYVKRNFLGGRTATTLTQANQDVLTWCETTAGWRMHGTTKEQPLTRFQAVEQAHLQPLPATPYDLAIWKVAKLQRDCHVTFDNAYYSAPFRLVGQTLRIRGSSQTVQLYTSDYQLVATHDRAHHPGQRQTHPAHLPPEKLPGLYLTRELCQTVAQDIGTATAAVVQHLFTDPVVERLPMVQRLLKLRERFGDRRLEAACARALQFDDPSYMTVKRILVSGHDTLPAVPAPVRAPAQTFVRTAGELVGHLFGGAAWS